jgi:hypothetical protein
MRNTFTTLAAAALLAGALTGPANASKGGGGGGGTKPVLQVPAIAPATFEGIGTGPVYVHESFGRAQRTRYTESGSIIDAVDKPEINGIRAEFPNNQTETWIGTRTSGSASWRFSVTSPIDPFEPYTPLQDSPEFGIQDGSLSIVGAEVGTPDERPAALLPFAAPTGSAFTVSGDTVAFIGKTAIGFSSSSATSHNFETSGQAWLEFDTFGRSVLGGNTGITRWTFHAGATTLTGTYDVGPTGYNRMAVSYDPFNHVAAATVDGTIVASLPLTAESIRYVGVEGSLHGHIDNFTVRAGTVSDPDPAAVAAPTTPVTTRF